MNPTVTEKFDGRALVLQLGSTKSYISAPVSLAIANDVTRNAFQIGFVHSGYTAVDPDGKSAILTVTLQIAKRSLSKEEVQKLQTDGIAVMPPVINASSPQQIEIDVSLPSDVSEESRIKRLLKLPKSISGTSASIPFQIKWTDVPGKTLYKWLTDDSGLSFVLRYRSAIIGRLKVEELIPLLTRQSWWLSRNGGAEDMICREGLVPVVIDLLTFSGSWNQNSTVNTVKSTDGMGLQRAVQILSAVATQQGDQSLLLKKDAFLGADWESAKVDISVPVMPISTLLSGPTLLSVPDLVKDLSGSGKGLDALLLDDK